MCGANAIPLEGTSQYKQKKTKTNKEGPDKKEWYLNYVTVIKYAFCLLVCIFSSREIC